MNDYSAFCMKDWKWYEDYKAKMGYKALYEYRNRLQQKLDNMKDGDILIVDRVAKKENIELFIKCVCVYIITGHGSCSFNNTFTIFKKHDEHKMVKRGNKLSEGIASNKDIKSNS